jgi:uncharacterized repeat protein (TIGR03806 family)
MAVLLVPSRAFGASAHGRLVVSAAVVMSLACVGCNREPALELPTRCVAPPRPTYAAQVELQRVFPALEFSKAVALVRRPSDDSRWYVVGQEGVVWTFAAQAEVEQAEVFVDLGDVLAEGGEAGLLGMTFHPRFADNGYVYLSYTTPGGSRFVSRISRFESRDGGRTLDRGSQTEVITVDQPYSNHNGGDIHFGPDGYLYIGLGDGGSGGDPQGHGQNTDTLLGAILRIDVDVDVDAGSPYGIPPDNPFADTEGGRPEIFAWGLRNPWRFSFDRETGDLWTGDVGQHEWEEVNLVVRGGNYGWNPKEGNHCFAAQPCDTPAFIDPVAEYANPGDASVIGGYVYRGSAIPALTGHYLYADFYMRRLWGVVPGQAPRDLGGIGRRIAGFAEDLAGEVYALDYTAGIYRVAPAAGAIVGDLPRHLAQTGCVDHEHAQRAPSWALEYAVNVPFWSDGADKDRWLAVPDDSTIDIAADGRVVLPVGSVLVKTFRLDDRPIETRLFVRHDDGDWAGYTYAWDDDGKDAELLVGASVRQIGDVSWIYPGREQCLSCHTAAAGHVLGMHTGQLAGVASGALVALVGEELSTAEPLASPAGEASLAERARAYLHVNCSNCHRPEGNDRTTFDLRVATPLSETGICDTAPDHGDLGITDARLLVPGDPGRSVLVRRMAATDETRMPGLGSTVVDAEGVTLVESWIRELIDCS